MSQPNTGTAQQANAQEAGNTGIAAAGTVSDNGLFWTCGGTRQDGDPCLSRVINRYSSIRNHFTKHHTPDSAYQRDQDGSRPWYCIRRGCEDRLFRNWNSLLGHHRHFHGFRGVSAGLKARSAIFVGGNRRRCGLAILKCTTV
ncbi:uncharacterized protein GGS25DRAFT_521127 [Hypoxylon fragiforme]|uniref:uncharacterized protein n=1 Tax=Hypoxylon fragiforme TaxID=63214 RepID=UPI0020C6B379|nr:uncharacterized protein GGS25DRAFT_521127 [Hypoxylon fragiforme]KAI2610326.1 hypothetical protein GGS25DRAFT_521127 [Hypoxylon fragiforme]